LQLQFQFTLPCSSSSRSGGTNIFSQRTVEWGLASNASYVLETV
jgi:hypothetical protein